MRLKTKKVFIRIKHSSSIHHQDVTLDLSKSVKIQRKNDFLCVCILGDISHDLNSESFSDCGAPWLMICHPSLTQGGLQLLPSLDSQGIYTRKTLGTA